MRKAPNYDFEPCYILCTHCCTFRNINNEIHSPKAPGDFFVTCTLKCVGYVALDIIQSKLYSKEKSLHKQDLFINT